MIFRSTIFCTLLMAFSLTPVTSSYAQADQVIPTTCFLEHYHEGTLIRRYEGRCGYEMPLFVSPTGGKPSVEIEPNGVLGVPASPIPATGLHAILRIGRNVVPETATLATPMVLDYKLVEMEGGNPSYRASRFTGLIKPGAGQIVQVISRDQQTGTDELRVGFVLNN